MNHLIHQLRDNVVFSKQKDSGELLFRVNVYHLDQCVFTYIFKKIEVVEPMVMKPFHPPLHQDQHLLSKVNRVSLQK